MIDARELSHRLSRDVEAVCRKLLPNGKRSGKDWCAGDISGAAGESLRVQLVGSKVGLWADFAGDEKGDLLDLWRLTQRLSMAETIREVKRYLHVDDPTFEKPYKRTYTRPQKPLCQTPVSTVLNYLTQERLLTPETIQAFRIGESNNEIILPYLKDGELYMVKHLSLQRNNGKKAIRVSPDAEPILFGWQAVDPASRVLFITEGEIDAMTLHQYGYPAVSLPFGAGVGDKHTWIESEWDTLSYYDTIYLAFDIDDEGQKAAINVSKRLGLHRCRIIDLPAKDMNECLKAGISKETLQTFIDDARTHDPKELKRASHYVDKVVEHFHPKNNEVPGLEYPWPALRNDLRIRHGELTLWTGINGHGKSQMLGLVILNLMGQGERCCIASMEILPHILLSRLTRQATGCRTPASSYIRQVHEWLDDKLWLFAASGAVKSDKILEVFEYARRRYGVTTFVIDSLMKCGFSEDDYNSQKHFIEGLQEYCLANEVHVHLVAHARKGFNEQAAPGKMDVKGTGALTDIPDNVVTVWRNKKKESHLAEHPDDAEWMTKPDALIECHKQRNADGWEGKLWLWFHRASMQFLDSQSQKAREYVPYTPSITI